EIEFLLYRGKDFGLKDSIDQTDLANRGDYFVELDLPCDFLPYSEYDSFNSQDFSNDDDLPSSNNEDKVKEKQEKDKIGTKPDKTGSVEKPGNVEGQSQSRKQKKEKKIQVQGTKICKSYKVYLFKNKDKD
nr:hypothetical protein [Tanacetum cinerariifolium]